MDTHHVEEERQHPTQNKSSIDWINFIIKRWWVLLILIPLIITVMIRLEPMKLVPMEKSAEAGVINYYRSMIRAEIDKQFPNIPEGQRAELAEQKLQEAIQKTGKEQFRAYIKQNTDALKSKIQYQSGKNTYVYLGDIDSYYWLRQSRNIIEKGMQCDVVKDDRCYDSYTLAPNIIEKPIDYYPIVIVGVYNVLKIFNSDISLMQASFLTPLFFALVFTVPLFLLLRKIKGNVAAVIGSVLLNVNPHVLSRSLGSDSDIINIFFQVIFLWLAIECFYAPSLRNKVIWASLSGVLLSLYSRFWGGWWYLADLFIFALIVNGVYLVLQKWYTNKRFAWEEFKGPLKQIAFPAFSLVIVLIIFFWPIFHSPAQLWGTVTSQLGVLSLKKAANPNYWPNVLTTVAEFNSMGIDGIISAFGSFAGMGLYLMAILGIIFLIFPTIKFINKNKLAFVLFIIANIIIYLIMKSSTKGTLVFLLMIPIFIGIFLHLRIKEKETFHPDAVFLLTIIICMVTYFSFIGVRFLFLMAVPISIFVAIFFEGFCRILLSLIRRLLALPKLITNISLVILISLFLLTPVQIGFATAQSYMPNVSDEWVETLEKIKQSSKSDAIINSWWDFGHWFKYFADRRVTLDGSSQNNPQLHWLGKLLLTSNETISRGILRMLDCGGNNAFDAINEKMNDTPHAVYVINQVIIEKKSKAANILAEHGFSSAEIQNILSYTHCNPPEDFLITSEDMIGKSGVWAHFGSWDFKKSYLSSIAGDMPQNEIIKKFKEDYNIDEATTKSWIQELISFKEQGEINSWIAPWPSYYSGFTSCDKQANISLCSFSQGENKFDIVIDFKQKEAYVKKSDGAKVAPAAVAFVNEASYDILIPSGETFYLGVVVQKTGDSIDVMYMDPALVGSMFTRLFFFDGIGLSSFEKFYDTTNVFGGRIITWKVVWDAEDK